MTVVKALIKIVIISAIDLIAGLQVQLVVGPVEWFVEVEIVPNAVGRQECNLCTVVHELSRGFWHASIRKARCGTYCEGCHRLGVTHDG